MIRTRLYLAVFILFIPRLVAADDAPAADDVRAVVFNDTGDGKSGDRLDVDALKGADFDRHETSPHRTATSNRGTLVVYDDAMPRLITPADAPGGAVVAFLDAGGTVLDIATVQASRTGPSARSPHPARYTVLAPAAWLSSHSIKTGSRVAFVTAVSQIAAVAFPGGHVKVELARSSSEIKRGLMFRDTLDADAGMLFIFPGRQRLSFWMKNTKVPLSIAFIDASLKVLNVDDMAPFDDISRHLSHGEALYALEVNKGWLASHHVVAGTQATFLKEVREVRVRPHTWVPSLPVLPTPLKPEKGL